MEENLKLIQFLRQEIKELTNDKEKKEKDYTLCMENIKESSSELDEMKKKFDNLNLFFENVIDGKIIKFLLPFAIIVTICLYLIINPSSIVDDLKALGYATPIICGIVSYFIPYVFCSTFLREPIKRIFIKRNSYIKKIHNNLKELSNNYAQKEDELNILKKDSEFLDISLQRCEVSLNEKKEELYKLEEEYFDNLIGKTFIAEDGNHHTVGIVGRGKTKVRIPEDKNLSN